MSTKKTTTKKTPQQQFVGKDEFEKFAGGVMDALENITNRLNTPAAPEAPTTAVAAPAAPTTPAQPAVDADPNGMLQPQYQKLFEKYFDPEDGFTARMVFPEIDEKTGMETGGIMFTICVPEKFSNTTDAYRKLYKQDLRSRALQPAGIVKGIEDWCKAVAKNLKYNRNIKTK